MIEIKWITSFYPEDATPPDNAIKGNHVIKNSESGYEYKSLVYRVKIGGHSDKPIWSDWMFVDEVPSVDLVGF